MEIPIKVESTIKGRYLIRVIQTAVVNGDILWLFRKNTLSSWKATIGIGQENKKMKRFQF